MDQPSLFPPGNDLDWCPGCERRAIDKRLLIACVADGACGYGPDAHHVQLAIHLGHPRQDDASGENRLLADRTRAEHALPKARDLAFGNQNLRRLAGEDLRGFHANGVASDVDSGVARHITIVNRKEKSQNSKCKGQKSKVIRLRLRAVLMAASGGCNVAERKRSVPNYF